MFKYFEDTKKVAKFVYDNEDIKVAKFVTCFRSLLEYGLGIINH